MGYLQKCLQIPSYETEKFSKPFGEKWFWLSGSYHGNSMFNGENRVPPLTLAYMEQYE